MSELDPAAHIALALDVPNLGEAERLIAATRGHVGVFKIGLELFTAEGPAAVEAVHAHGARCFLDLKLHDIAATMGRAVARASNMGVEYLTVHAAAGTEALQTAQQQAGSTQLLAVTVLTSLDASAVAEIGLVGDPAAAADRLARLAWNAGIRGFVSSAHECAQLRQALGPEAWIVTPGIRPEGGDVGDQRRVMTPAQAIDAGAALLVIGRPIRDADDPGAAAAAVAEEVESALRR